MGQPLPGAARAAARDGGTSPPAGTLACSRHTPRCVSTRGPQAAAAPVAALFSGGLSTSPPAGDAVKGSIENLDCSMGVAAPRGGEERGGNGGCVFVCVEGGGGVGVGMCTLRFGRTFMRGTRSSTCNRHTMHRLTALHSDKPRIVCWFHKTLGMTQEHTSKSCNVMCGSGWLASCGCNVLLS